PYSRPHESGERLLAWADPQPPLAPSVLLGRSNRHAYLTILHNLCLPLLLASCSKRVSEKGSCVTLGQPAEHDTHHDGVQDTLRGGGQVLVILTGAAPAPNPPQRALDDPPARLHLESLRHLRRFAPRWHPDPAARPPHDGDGPAQRLLHPLFEAALVGGI